MLKRNTAMQAVPDPKTYIVQASALSSMEVYSFADGTQDQVLKGIDLEVKRGECWGILGEEPFELELLTEIIGCVRPYGSGRVVLVERGMMRKKRRILPHVFYISDGDSVFPNMNTLEYLMFITAHSGIPARQRQADILRLLLDTGLYYMTLVPIKYLTRPQKAVISLMAACFSSALLVIFSVSQLEFDQRLSGGIRGIAEVITKRGGAVVIASRDCDMVQEACTHTAFLLKGTVRHSGTMEEMLSRLDKRIFMLASGEPQVLCDALATSFPELTLKVLPSAIHIYDYRPVPITQGDLFASLIKAGIPVESVAVSQKRLKNAYGEVLNGHDL